MAIVVSRFAWVEAVHDFCGGHFGGSEAGASSVDVQVQRGMSLLRSRILDGRSAGNELTLATLTRDFSQIAPGKEGRDEFVVPEFIKELPFYARIRILDLFGGRLCRKQVEVESWKVCAPTGLPKKAGALPLEEIRWIARTSCLQKWYLRCSTAMLDKSLPQQAVQTVGFREGFSVATVVETLKQAFFLDDRWDLGLLCASRDVKQAFDEMEHDMVAEGVYSAGGDLRCGVALIGEMGGLKGRATPAEAQTTPDFPMRKGCRTGGVETPTLLNLLLQKALAPVVKEWTDRGWGFAFDGELPISHLLWADNAFTLAMDMVQLPDMVAMATQAIRT